jgi:hypothetical protein
MKVAVFWVVAPCSLVTEAASASETSVNIYQTTRCNTPENSHLRHLFWFQSKVQGTKPGEFRRPAKFWLGGLNERDQSEVLGIDGRIILK